MPSMKDAKLIKKSLLVNKFKKVVLEKLQFSDGVDCDWIYLDSPKSVAVVAVTPENEVVLVSLYRHNIKLQATELPAGGVDADDMHPEAAARRELIEETGYDVKDLVDLGQHYVLPSETNRWVQYFLAKNAVKVGEPTLDNIIERYWDMSVLKVPLQELTTVKGCQQHGVTGIEAQFGLRLAQEYLADN